MKILDKLTQNYLKLNKKRTLVTIIGIILSGAMITAVATLAVSFKGLMLEAEIAQNGAWEAIFKQVGKEQITTIQKSNKFQKTTVMVDLGMARNEYSDDAFIRIKSYDKEALENQRVIVRNGRLPTNSEEIVLSRSFFDGKENEPKIGDKVTFTLGKRMADGIELTKEKEKPGETFKARETKTYQVVGIIEKPEFETRNDNYVAGITCYQESDLVNVENVTMGVITKNPSHIFEDTEKIAKEIGNNITKQTTSEFLQYNESVLMYKGVSDSLGFNEMLISVCGILVLVIAIGSILVIYNSFAISVSERKKQFGMLSSIGATKKQIKYSVLQEGITLGFIGIPIGIITGVLGIAITLQIVNSLLSPMFRELGVTGGIPLVISWPAILISALLLVVTIYLSVIIPARKASKITPIDAIRQTEDIKIKAKKVKSPRIFRKLFGMEGEIALKNLKRSKKRYRTTVISLIISIVLFISVSGFVEYTYGGFDSLYQTVEYDAMITSFDKTRQKNKDIMQEVQNMKGTSSVTTHEILHGVAQINELSTQMKKARENNTMLKEILGNNTEEGNYQISTQVVAMNEKSYQKYLKQIGISDLKENEAILIHYADLLRAARIEGELTALKENDTCEVDFYQGDESIKEEFKIAKISKEAPIGLKITNFPMLILIIPEARMNELIEKTKQESSQFSYITMKEDKLVEEQLEELSKRENIRVENIKEEVTLMKNIKLVIQIFLYGFITLISAIGIANIFNTISTNINLRRREFAMLKSIGMTDKAFQKMLNLECVFYGTKALLYGIPIGVFICYLINQGFANMVQFAYQLPWNSIFISIIAVYMIVFVTMLYSSRKVKKENIIDVLREDNV